MLGKRLFAGGMFVSVVALARFRASVRGAFHANPLEVSSLLTRLGYSSPPSEAELMIVGYQYAFLRRRPFPELDGTAVHRGRNALLLWFVLALAGLLIAVAGLIVELVEINADRL
jgi:hypothetical protein